MFGNDAYIFCVWCTYIVNIVRYCVFLTMQKLYEDTLFQHMFCQMHKPQIKQLMIKMYTLLNHLSCI